MDAWALSITGSCIGAQTGSGKTAAFLIPAIQLVLTNRLKPMSVAEVTAAALRKTVYPRVLILSPTRELATQIHLESRKFCFKTGVRAAAVYGGQDIRLQVRDMGRHVDILIATPGRLLDFVERNRIGFAHVSHLSAPDDLVRVFNVV